MAKGIPVTLWGRRFELPAEINMYKGEEILQSQYDSIIRFKNINIDMGDSLHAVADYCFKRNPREFKYDNKGNIFKYIIPKYLFISRTNGTRTVAIMCNYKFDSDNGIAIVFKNEKFDSVGNQDSIL